MNFLNLNEYNVIKCSQHGFTRDCSCLRNLVEFVEKVYEAGRCNLSIFCQDIKD